jgi:hypothetical protein
LAKRQPTTGLTLNAIPTFPRWRRLDCPDKAVLDRFCKEYAPYAEATLATLLVWNEPLGCEISQLNGNVLLRHKSCGGALVNTFLGSERPIETARELLASTDTRVSLVPGYSLKNTTPDGWVAAGLEIVPDRDNYDYVYCTDRLAGLPGRDLKRRHKRLMVFEREWQPEYVELNLSSTTDVEAVLRCVEVWFRQLGVAHGAPPVEELDGLERVLRFVVEGALSGLLGFGVRVGGELVAVSIIETHGTVMVSGVLFKALREFPGAGEFLRSASAGNLATYGYAYLNAQQDLGLEGLRRMKSSYRPIAMLRKWTIQPVMEAARC